MKNLINTILLSIFISSSAFTNTPTTLEPKQLDTISYAELQTQSGKEVNINQKLEDIEEIIKYMALMQVQAEENNQKQSSIKSSAINSQTKTTKAIALAKEGFWNMVGAGKFTIDKIKNIMSKEFLIAACLVLGTATLAYAKLKPEVVAEKIVTVGMKTGGQLLDGAVKAAWNNPKTVAKIAGGGIGIGGAFAIGQGVVKKTGEVVGPKLIDYSGTALKYLGIGVYLGGKYTLTYATWLFRKIGHRQQL